MAGRGTLAALFIDIEGRGALATLNKITLSAHNAGRATEHFERTTKNLTRSLGVLGGYFGVRQLVEYADTWTLISARVGLVTNSTEQMMTVQYRLFEIAQKTRNTLAATSVLYTRVALNADQLGRSHEELLGVVSAVNSAMLISGATGVESAQAMRQFAQALGSGRVQGDEFRTMMEAMPMVARAIADEMGVAMGDLYKLSKDGLIDVQTVIDALLKKQGELEEKAAQMPWTVGQAFEYFQNAVTATVGIINAATFAGGRLAEGIKYLADHMTEIVAALGAVAIGMAAYKTSLMGVYMYQQLVLAAKTIKMWWELATMIRSAADAAYLLGQAVKGASGILIAIAAAGVGFAVYKKLVAEIAEETEKWKNANAPLDEQLGTLRDRMDEEAMRRRYRIEDMIREAHQTVVLAGVTEDAQERMKIQFDAVNKRIEARRELQGEALNAMLGAINVEERLLLQAQAYRSELEKLNKVIEEHFKILDRFAENLQREVGDVFFDIMNEGIARFEDLFDAIKVLFYRMLSDMASAALMASFGEDIKRALSSAFSASAFATSTAASSVKFLQETTGAHMPEATRGDKPLVVSIGEIKNPVEQSFFAKMAKAIGPILAGYGVGRMAGSMLPGEYGMAGVAGGASGAITGALMAGLPGAILGGVAGVLGGLMGSMDAEREELRRHREVLEQNNLRLQEVRDELEGTSLIHRLGGALEAIARVREIIANNPTMEAYRLSEADRQIVRAIASELGIDLNAPGALEQLIEMIELTTRTLTEFGNNLQDLTTSIDAYNQLFDIEVTPQQALADMYKILNQMAPELMEQLGLVGLDLTTEAGRQALLEGLRQIYMMIASGDFTNDPELLGAFADKDQLIDTILKTKDALDKFHEQLYDVTTDFPRAMDIIYYEQKYGRYGMSGLRAGGELITETASGGFNVQGGITIVVKDTATGTEILDRVTKAANRRYRRGGAVELEQESGW